MGNFAQLSYWQGTTYSKEDLDSVCAHIDNNLAARFDILKGRSLCITLSRKVDQTLQGHLPVVALLIRSFVETWVSEETEGSFVVWLEDGMWDTPFPAGAPIYAFGRGVNDTHTLLMPDPAFINSQGYLAELKEMSEIGTTLPWEKRKPIVFWRGANSGLGGLGKEWRRGARAQIVLRSKEWESRGTIDCSFTKLVTYPESSVTEEIESLGLVTTPSPFIEFLKYRYLIDVDGEFCAWRSLFLKLGSGSLVLKVQSAVEQWYYDRIKPWIHYVPLRPDLADLEERIDWVNSHDEECRHIAHNAGNLIKELNFDNEYLTFAKETDSLLSCYRR